MLKLMIVDDEPLVRLGLESMINWEECGYTLLPAAVNGEEGLNNIFSLKPDVVITDIKMPVMDGIEMISKCREKGLDTKFVVLSSYDEFQLVKKVMQLGAADYLIKINLSEKELKEVLEKLKEEVGERAKARTQNQELKEYLSSNQKTLRQDFIRKLVFGMIDLSDKNMMIKQMSELEMKEETSYGLCCVKLTAGEHKNEIKSDDMTSFYLVNMCQDILDNFGQGFVFLRNEEEVLVFMEIGETALKDKAVYKDFMVQLSRRLLEMIRQYFSKMAVAGISRVYDKMTGLNQAFKESRQAIQIIDSGDKLPIYFYNDKMKAFEKNNNKIDILDLKDSMVNAMDTGDEKQLNTLFDTIYLRFKDCVTRQNAYEICYKLVYIVAVLGPNGETILKETFDKDYTRFENIQALATINEVVLWIERLQRGINEFISKKYLDVADIKVKKAKQYITQNVYAKITLPEVAEQMEISAGYLSTIFKKVEGKSFSDYIAEVKMGEAKKLLKEQNYKVYEVSSKLGYDDPYYFSKLFKKVTQMTPTEFMCKC